MKDNRNVEVTRAPLTTQQHILHLILTLVTGFWFIIWIIRAIQGNKTRIIRESSEGNTAQGIHDDNI